jgi:hypothetical protein
VGVIYLLLPIQPWCHSYRTRAFRISLALSPPGT